MGREAIDKIRAFIAFGLPAPLRAGIDDMQKALKGYRFKVRWVRPESIHLTLKFLSDITLPETTVIAGAMEAAASGVGPIALSVNGIGVFPDHRRPRVIWAGLSGDLASLNTLYTRLETELAAAGFPKEKRGFKGHLALGRTKGRIDPERLAEVLRNSRDYTPGTFIAANLSLFQSDLRPSGAVYTELISTRLGSVSGT